MIASLFMRMALVELEVEYGREIGGACTPREATPLALAARPGARCARVAAAISDARSEGADVILLPLWTLPSPTALAPLLPFTNGVTMVVEVMGTHAGRLSRKGVASPANRSPSRTFVVQDGCIVTDPGIEQLFCSAAEVNNAIGTLDQSSRWVGLPDGSKLFLLVCGESNARRTCATWNHGALRWGFEGVPWSEARAILNPAHTVPSAGRMIQKWHGLASLTSGKRLYHTANLHPRHRKVARAGRSAAYIVTEENWMRPVPVVERNGYSIRLDILP